MQSNEEIIEIPEEHPGYYAVIPADVRYHPELGPNDKLLYSEISALCSKKGYCWATNAYLAKLLRVTTRNVQLSLARLKAVNVVEVEIIDRNRRKIYLLVNGLRVVEFDLNEENFAGERRKLHGGTKKTSHLYMSIKENTTLNKHPEAESLPINKNDKGKIFLPDARAVLEHFNRVCGRSFHITAARLDMVRALLKQGATLEDLKKAADNFAKDTWVDRPKFMDPVYCFGTINKKNNFEKWLHVEVNNGQAKEPYRKML